MVDPIPEDDIEYSIYVRECIEHGLADEAAGRVHTQEEVEERMKKWLDEPAFEPFQVVCAHVERASAWNGDFSPRSHRSETIAAG